MLASNLATWAGYSVNHRIYNFNMQRHAEASIQEKIGVKFFIVLSTMTWMLIRHGSEVLCILNFCTRCS